MVKKIGITTLTFLMTLSVGIIVMAFNASDIQIVEPTTQLFSEINL